MKTNKIFLAGVCALTSLFCTNSTHAASIENDKQLMIDAAKNLVTAFQNKFLDGQVTARDQELDDKFGLLSDIIRLNQERDPALDQAFKAARIANNITDLMAETLCKIIFDKTMTPAKKAQGIIGFLQQIKYFSRDTGGFTSAGGPIKGGYTFNDEEKQAFALATEAVQQVLSVLQKDQEPDQETVKQNIRKVVDYVRGLLDKAAA